MICLDFSIKSMDFGGYCDPEPGVCIFRRFSWAWTLFTTSIKSFFLRKILSRKCVHKYFAFCHHDSHNFKSCPTRFWYDFNRIPCYGWILFLWRFLPWFTNNFAKYLWEIFRLIIFRKIKIVRPVLNNAPAPGNRWKRWLTHSVSQ